MKYLKIFILCFVFIIPLIFPSLSSAEIKVLLKNGNSIIAEDCRDAGSKLICERMGGTFEIDKKDVINLKEVTLQIRGGSEEQEQPAEPAAEPGARENDQGTEKKASDVKEPEKQGEGEVVSIRRATPEEENRLNQINQRKTELKAEREKLINDRKQLHEDIKSAGVVMERERVDELNRRIADLDAKINRFNEEAKKLNDEENKIYDNIKSRK